LKEHIDMAASRKKKPKGKKPPAKDRSPARAAKKKAKPVARKTGRAPKAKRVPVKNVAAKKVAAKKVAAKKAAPRRIAPVSGASRSERSYAVAPKPAALAIGAPVSVEVPAAGE